MALINNAGGSLSSALLLTMLAWGVRWLRAELNRRKREEEACAAASRRSLGRFTACLSPVALRMLVETGPCPHHIFTLRAAGSGPHEALPPELRGALRLPESRVATVLGSAATWGEAFQGVPYPPPHAVLVFVGDTEEEELRAAASAASCGYQRALVLGGGLQQLGLGAGSGGGGAGGAPPPPQPAADLRFINRDALAVLLGMAVDESGGGGVMHAPPTTLIDVRRSDERALYGAIKGSVHIPVDQLASALALPPDQFTAQYRFPKPSPEDLVVFSCRTNVRAGWAAQLAADAGLPHSLVLRCGVYGWRIDPAVKPYRGYRLQEAPPEAEAFTVEPERFARKNETQQLRAAFEALDANHDDLICADELRAYFESAGHKAKKTEVEDMIWEVDEDCDGLVKWPEFQAMWQRCREDKAGTEPRGLYNVVLFLLHAKECGVGGEQRMALEEAMKITYLRVGKESLDAQLAAVFGTADLNSGKSLSLTQFLNCLHAHQLQQIRSRPTMTRRQGSGNSNATAASPGAPAAVAVK
ncbi:outer dynein arm-docking complex subunit 3 isoform B [Micractinium conductrix]|uniref:Outer dynein arm-docking complex subunit 3 isoform A n=1 Tax=Micractinium conductrix TaxID=554055 RepID=A0A2P6VDC1_9CHLO|nr:outer dynein arm-docking complex subunit 3 isoform A [Micractinium conductrix]PSC72096.1 outer dynein arm-docking complex subunit 3 isoform B [Micractinium conductrix]|eukprot:PSC72095.1 outer dynein arm-docking complex subunit 3 isoform A [Micractinium conductrix]